MKPTGETVFEDSISDPYQPKVIVVKTMPLNCKNFQKLIADAHAKERIGRCKFCDPPKGVIISTGDYRMLRNFQGATYEIDGLTLYRCKDMARGQFIIF